MKTKTHFPWRSFLQSLAVIAIPVALQNLLTTTGSMVDTIMIASLGETAVGAVGLCAQFSSLMFSSYWGFVGGGMLFFAQYWGAQDEDGLDRSYGLTLTCMMVVAALFTCFALAAPETVMRIYTDKASIQKIGVEYLRIVGFAYPMQIFSMAMSAVMIAISIRDVYGNRDYGDLLSYSSMASTLGTSVNIAIIGYMVDGFGRQSGYIISLWYGLALTLAMGALFIVSVRGGRKIAAEYKTQSHSPANAAGDTANH